MILVTGATGFVGAALINDLYERSFKIRSASRRPLDGTLPIDQYLIENINGSTDWSGALKDIDIIIHSAARVHVMQEHSTDALHEYRETNTLGTINLAQQAAKNGVKRFIFLSSIKVNGEQTFHTPFTEEDPVNPSDPYGLSKYEAEQALFQIAKSTGMEIVIIRPPLVYGPKVKANFYSLMKLANLNIPLPFAGIENPRSMIFLHNLTDFIIKCIDHPKAKNQIFLVSDQRDLSLPELTKYIRSNLNKSEGIFNLPLWFFKFLGWLLRKPDVIHRLTGKLQVDTSKATRMLGWTPHYTSDEAISLTVLSFIEEKEKK